MYLHDVNQTELQNGLPELSECGETGWCGFDYCFTELLTFVSGLGRSWPRRWLLTVMEYGPFLIARS
jgi:hypothetical protein